MSLENSEKLHIKSNFSKILVAVDYLPSTTAIFDQALNLAEKFKSHLMIFHCIQGEMPGISDIIQATTKGGYGGISSQEEIIEEQLFEETTAELAAWLRSFAQKAHLAGITADFDYRVGQPGLEICDLAKSWGANLIILGRHPHNLIQEIVLGSVSNYVLHHASCSVLVIKHA